MINAEELISFRHPPKTEWQINEEKIQAKMRELAIESLKASDSEFPKDYK